VRETLLSIHVLAAAAWIGGSLLLGFAGPRMGRAGGAAAGAWLHVVLDAVTRFFIPAAVLTLASGLLIVTTQEPWDWSDAFVGIGIAAVVIAVSIAVFNNVPSLRRMLASAQAGDMTTVAANARRVMVGGVLISLILIGTEFAMVLRIGAG
jgi:hypothetical protein